MRSIGFRNKESAYATQDYALKKQYPCRLSVLNKDGITAYLFGLIK